MSDDDIEPKPHDFESISGSMVRGTAWMISMRWSLKLIGVVNTVIVARLLAPDDFGVMAMAMIVVGFLTEIAETNVAVALIRNQHATEDDYNSAWTVNIMVGGLLAVVLFTAAPLMAKYYGDPRVETVIQIIAFRPLIFAFENIGVVDFRKNMQFAKEFRYGTYQRLTEFAISLTIVYILRDYHALAIGTLVWASVAVFYSYMMSPYRPRPSFRKIGSLWSVSQWLMVDHGSRFVGRRVDEFVLGPIVGSAVVGNYFMASEVSSMPTREVIIPAGRALIPTYAKVAHDEAESRKAFLRVFGLIAIYALPAGVGISVVSADLVPILLGAQWTTAIPFFQWFGIYAASEAFMWGVRPYFLARGGERVYALAGLGYACVLVPAIVAAANLSGVMAVLMTRTGLSAGLVVALLLLTAHLGYARVGELFSAIWRPLIASIVMWGVLYGLPDITVGWHIVSLLRDVAVGGAVYVAATMALWFLTGRCDGAERIVFGVVSSRAQRFLK